MNSVKKILIQLKTQMSHIVDDFENHEQLTAIAIDEIERIGRNSRIQLNRVRNRIVALEKSIEEQQEKAQKWSQRAVKLESSDRERALNCVKRLQEAEKQIEILRGQHQEAIVQEQKIAADLTKISEQIGELKTRRENLIARQHVAQVSTSTQHQDKSPAEGANALFERWENKVVGSEFDVHPVESADVFAEQFEQQEHEAELNARLANLVAKSQKSN